MAILEQNIYDLKFEDLDKIPCTLSSLILDGNFQIEILLLMFGLS